MTQPDIATQRQIAATDPDGSFWLSANAGSGKTRVLTARVARLLLTGTRPQNILCLTYTKAAASEMQNRLFQQLGQWSMLPEPDLRARLAELGVTAISDAELVRARSLFASAIETPGGLRIQTIHAFCAALLRKFPLEARIPPQIREIDDRETADLRADVLAQMAEGPAAPVLRRIAGFVNDADLQELAKEVVGAREAFGLDDPAAHFKRVFGLSQAPQPQELVDALLTPERIAALGALARAVAPLETTTAKSLARKLDRLVLDPPQPGDIDILLGAFLTGADTKTPFAPKVNGLLNAAFRAEHAAVIEVLNPLMEELAEIRPTWRAWQAYEKGVALHEFGRAFLDAYAQAKLDRGVLDFDDQIAKAAALLDDPNVADWVRFKLDGGIDHILVDEAQDTSPSQWRVIRALAEEFGQNAEDGRRRTIFVVGDKKQSIYSFQGADPAEFDRMRAHFAAQLESLSQPFAARELEHSFRSSPVILSFVDALFADRPQGGFEGIRHAAWRAHPGRVDIWPAVPAAQKPGTPDWCDPAPIDRATDPRVMLARRIASEIGRMIGSEQIADKDGAWRPVRPGDFLILVQRRKELFDEIIQACKAAGLPIAGADRMKITEEVAVRDILAVLSFLALPRDDLSLAEALRSPLFGLDEQALFTLAHGRPRDHSLWQALEGARDRHPEAFAILSDLAGRADFLSPYQLIERLLTHHGGRMRLLERLGTEAAEGIDEFLNLALDYEGRAPATLTGFLAYLEGDATEIKRQTDAGGDKIRVMTAHGAKGLESPIVILPETHQLRPPGNPKTMMLPDGSLAWRAAKDVALDLHETAKAQEQQLRHEERMRLFYVAMTRAERWLILCGVQEAKPNPDSWFEMARETAARLGASPVDTAIGTVARLEFGDWPDSSAAGAPPDAPDATAVPGWAELPPPPEPARPRIVSPSDLAGPKSLAATDDASGPGDLAALRGTAIHALLEHAAELRQAGRETWQAVIERVAPELGDTDRQEVLRQFQAVLTEPSLQFILAPDVLAEVPVTAPLAEGEIMHGVLDRLVFRPDGGLLIVDFKSNAVVPASPQETPAGILAQIAAYRRALAQIYPRRPIEAAILWTAGPLLMPLPHKLVITADPLVPSG